MKSLRCKGMRDLTPKDMAKFRRIEAAFIECCRGWGYQEIRTPTLEFLHLFTSVGTLSPDMLGRVYSFLDWDGWSGERVVLRPDGTIPVARFYVENLQDISLARLFYVENTFAFESSGVESRERWQCGAELIGGRPLEGDVELITVALETMKNVGIESVQIRLAHAGVLQAFLESLGLSGEKEAEVLDQVFAGNTEVLRTMSGGNPEVESDLNLLFGLKGTTPGFVNNLKAAFSSKLPRMEGSLDQLARVAELLTGLEYDYQIDFTSGRNFEYYTGVIFSFCMGDHRLGGGGRYDELIPLVGGKDVCASGIAIYVDELMKLITDESEREPVLIRTSDSGGLKTSLSLAGELRKAGYSAEFDLGHEDMSRFKWIVDLRSGKGIQLINKSTGKTWDVAQSDELVKQLRGGG